MQTGEQCVNKTGRCRQCSAFSKHQPLPPKAAGCLTHLAGVSAVSETAALELRGIILQRLSVPRRSHFAEQSLLIQPFSAKPLSGVLSQLFQNTPRTNTSFKIRSFTPMFKDKQQHYSSTALPSSAAEHTDPEQQDWTAEGRGCHAGSRR